MNSGTPSRDTTQSSSPPRRRLLVGLPRYLLLLPLLAAGCASAVKTGFNPSLSGDDMVRMTDDMAAKIAASAAVQAAIAREGQLRVVVEPVENAMVGEVLPRGPAEAFTGRIRSLLSRHAPDRFVWVMNRDAWQSLRQRELDFDVGPSPESVQPQYALIARFTTLTQEDVKHRSVNYLCVYQLTDLERRNILWTDKYEVKKVAVKGFLD